MSDEQDDNTLERRVRLPEPDVKNITVLTESLPNEPVLPWHHFDSPWLDRDSEDEQEASSTAEFEDQAESAPEAEPEETDIHQLTLELEELVSSCEAISETAI